MKAIPLFIAALAASTSVLASTNLTEIWQQAKQADTNIATAEYQAQISELQIQQGLARLLPTVSASSSYRAIGQDLDLKWGDGALKAGISISQPVYHQNALYFYDALKVKAGSGVYSIDAAKQSLMMSVTDAYFNALKAEDRVLLSEAELYAVQRQMEQTQKRYDVGLVAQTDVLDAKSSYATAKVNLITAQGTLDNSMESLAVLANTMPADISRLPDSLSIPMLDAAGVDIWIDLANKLHPTLLVDRQNLKYLALNQKSKKSENLPTVDASFTSDYSDLFDTGSASSGITSVFSLSVRLPLYDGGTLSSAIIENGININISMQRAEQNRRNIELNIRQIYRKIQTDVSNLNALLQAVESREGSLKATQAGYDVGTRNIVEVLNAQRATYAAKLNYRMAQYDIILGQLKLKQAAGVLSETDLADINGLLE